MPPRERRLYLWMVGVTAVIFCWGLTIADPDLWGHTLYGLRSIEQGVLAEENDPFSYTAPNTVWINHEWLTEYQMGWLWNHFGNTGLWWWRNVWVLIVFGTAAWTLHRARASVAAAVALWLFNAESLSHFVVFVRPQLATFGLFAVSLAILRMEWDTQSRRIWLLPLLMILWVNLHGGFLAGIAIQGLFLTAACAKAWYQKSLSFNGLTPLRMVSVFLLSTLATLINPYGFTMHDMLWYHLGTEQFVREWQPLWAAQQSSIYYVPYLLLTLAAIGYRRLKWIDLLVFAVVSYEAISHIRHTALLSISTMILLPGPMTEGLKRCFSIIHQQWSGNHRRPIRMAAVMGSMLILICIQIQGTTEMWRGGMKPWDIAVATKGDVPGVPMRGIRLIQSLKLKGNLVTDYGWAQFVIWHLYPDSKIAFDGRYRTVYSPKLEREFIEFQLAHVHKPKRTPMLDDYPTEIALISTTRGPCAYLDERSDWVRLYQDQQVSLYVKNLPKFKDIIHLASLQEADLTAPQSNWERFPGETGVPFSAVRYAAVSIR
ncbi:MAG: hypothetical protein ACKVT0_12505 [Planctomycetaceae bacterium]